MKVLFLDKCFSANSLLPFRLFMVKHFILLQLLSVKDFLCMCVYIYNLHVHSSLPPFPQFSQCNINTFFYLSGMRLAWEKTFRIIKHCLLMPSKQRPFLPFIYYFSVELVCLWSLLSLYLQSNWCIANIHVGVQMFLLL